MRDLLPGGDHLVGIGEVTSLWTQEGDPLVFYRGDYWALGAQEAPPEVDEASRGRSAVREFGR